MHPTGEFESLLSIADGCSPCAAEGAVQGYLRLCWRKVTDPTCLLSKPTTNPPQKLRTNRQREISRAEGSREHPPEPTQPSGRAGTRRAAGLPDYSLGTGI